MRIKFWCAVIVLFAVGAIVSAQSLHTPKPDSKERRAICDAAREHVVTKYSTKALPQPIVFHIDHVAVQDSYCFFEATPRFKDGSYVPPTYLPDMAYILCLKNQGYRWAVIADLSRSDVPTDAEIQTIKQRLPADFPRAVFSPAWQNIMSR